jgi:hypothetical protein
MKILFEGQVPKDPAYPEAIEDRYQADSSAYRIGVCDGASESFDSQTWATILSQQFIEEPVINEEWLDKALNTYSQYHHPSTLSWSKEAAFERGSFSSLIGIDYSPNDAELSVLAIGDSIAVLIDDETLIETFPYSKSIEFAQRPELFSTKKELNQFIFNSNFRQKHSRVWSLGNSSQIRLLCMTDAIAEWAFKHHENDDPVWQNLLALESQEEFEEMVRVMQQEGSMRVDDVTLLIISFE